MYSINNLNKLAQVGELVPETMNAFTTWDKLALADGAIPKKYKELMAIVVALTTQCPYCIELHRQRAVDAGSTRATGSAGCRGVGEACRGGGTEEGSSGAGPAGTMCGGSSGVRPTGTTGGGTTTIVGGSTQPLPLR